MTKTGAFVKETPAPVPADPEKNIISVRRENGIEVMLLHKSLSGCPVPAVRFGNTAPARVIWLSHICR